VTEPVPVVDDADVPATGSTVSLLATARNMVVLGELDSWSASPSGLVVTMHMTTTPEMAQLLNGQRTWASAYTQHTNTLVVFEGVASQSRPDRPSALTLDGVRVIAREHRRFDPRAQVPCRIELDADEGHRVTARTIDLSRSGCRVELPEPDTLAVGEMAVAELTLTDATVVRTSCEVLRLDERRREAILRFHDLTDAGAAAISSSVFAQLSAQGSSPVTSSAG
jgi:hypothetical protein